MQCFSAKRNTENLFDCDSATNRVNGKNFQFMNGMKVISCLWILIGHAYVAGTAVTHKDIPGANFYSKFNLEIIL